MLGESWCGLLDHLTSKRNRVVCRASTTASACQFIAPMAIVMLWEPILLPSSLKGRAIPPLVETQGLLGPILCEIPPDGYVARPGGLDEDLSAYQLYSSICYFYPELPNDPTGIILVRNDAKQYGACTVGNLIWPPTFYGAAELLKIAAFVANNRSWLEWGATCNEEQTINATKANVYISLQYQASTDLDSEAKVPDCTTTTILLFTSDSYANYGIPGAEQELSGPYRYRCYPRKYWQPKKHSGAQKE